MQGTVLQNQTNTINTYKEQLRLIANRYLESTDRLPVDCTWEELIAVFNEYDEYSYMNAYLNSIEVFPDKDYSINDTEGHIKGLRNYALYYNSALKSVCLNGITQVPSTVFNGCSYLEEIIMKKAETWDGAGTGGMLSGCSSLTKLVLPKLATIGNTTYFAANGQPQNLFNMNFPSLIGMAYRFLNGLNTKTLLVKRYGQGYIDSTFSYDTSRRPLRLAFIITDDTSVSTLSSSNYATDIVNCANLYTYVPSSLLATYQTATNWVTVHQAKTDGTNYNGIQAIEPNINDLRTLGVDFSFTAYANKKWDGTALVTDSTIGEEVDE